MNGRSSTALSETQCRSNSSERLPNLPMMPERITYSTHTPAVFFVFDRGDHFSAGFHGTPEKRIRIFHHHHHAHHGSKEPSAANRLRAEVQEFRSFIGHPKFRSSHRHLRYHA